MSYDIEKDKDIILSKIESSTGKGRKGKNCQRKENCQGYPNEEG